MENVRLLLKYLPIHSILIFVLLSLASYWISKKKESRLIAILLTGFIYSALFSSLGSALFTLGMSIVIYGFVHSLIKLKDQRTRKTLMYAGVVLSIFTLSTFKYNLYEGIYPPLYYLRPLGISYFTFKFIHIIVDVYRGRIKRVDFRTYLALIFFFPTFSAGPIDRYNRFEKDANNIKPLEKEDIDFSIRRIIHGLFKKYIIADYTWLFINTISPNIATTSRVRLLAIPFLLSIKIYYDFAGYTDIAVGLGRLFGYRVPENFSAPYLRRNLTLFWQNWHMTLTSWLREYIYMPMGKLLFPYLGKKHPWLLNSICQLVLMAIVGIWHGSTLNFVIWGLYHGIGLSVFRIYADIVKNYFPENIQIWINNSKISQYISTAVTFGFVSVGWLFFSYNFTTALGIIKRIVF